MLEVSALRIVWTNACKYHILAKGYPFPDIPLEKMRVSELERRTCRAYRLARDWLSGICIPKKSISIDATASTSVSDVRFVPGRDHLLLTISKAVWSVVTIWDITKTPPKRCCEWSPRGAIFSGFCLNSDPYSEATVAVSMLKDGNYTVELLALRLDGGTVSLESITSVKTNFRPITLQGDLIAVSDEMSQTAIWNWKHNTYAILDQKQEDDQIMWKTDRCIQVVFAHQSILVVRARSVNLFPYPVLKDRKESPQCYEPLAQHSFGWVDGVSTAICPFIIPCQIDTSASYPPIAMLVRSESDDPWSSDMHNVELYTFPPNPHFSESTSDEDTPSPPSTPPYIFPPIKVNQVHSLRGSLRCTDMILGKFGTAVWVQPKERAIRGLLWAEETYPLPAPPSINAHECLVAAVFPGSLNSNPVGSGEDKKCCCTNVTRGHRIRSNDLNNWTSLDYDESLGMIALGSSFGRVVILQL
ncbi:hypothetical protein BDQ17DRAFT_1538976 [Cyathus striatus]|nr:hypothetical protein BDQ17DRAFT_1538976 [Cyathus striatus]